MASGASMDSVWPRHVSVFPNRTRTTAPTSAPADREDASGDVKKPYRLSWTTPEDRLGEQTFLGFGRLSLLFECLKQARMTPGRPLDWSGAWHAVPMLTETCGRLESIPPSYRMLCQLLVIIGARTALVDEPEKLSRILLEPESRVMAGWESGRLGPPGSLLNVSAHIPILLNLNWQCGANASIAAAASRPSIDAAALRIGFARAQKALLDYAAGRDPNVPVTEMVDRLYPASVLTGNSMLASEWQSDPLMTNPVELQMMLGTIIATHMNEGKPNLEAYKAWLASSPSPQVYWQTSRLFVAKVRTFAARHLFSRQARSQPFDADTYDYVAALARYLVDFYLSEGHTLAKSGLITLTSSSYDSPDPEARQKIDLNAHKNTLFNSLSLGVMTFRQVTERIGTATDADELEALRERHAESSRYMTLACRSLIEQLGDLRQAGLRVSHSMASWQIQVLWHPIVKHISTVPSADDFDDRARIQTLELLRWGQAEHVKVWPRATNTVSQLDEILAPLRERVEALSSPSARTDTS